MVSECCRKEKYNEQSKFWGKTIPLSNAGFDNWNIR